MSRATVLALIAGLLLLSGCGGGNDANDDDGDDATTAERSGNQPKGKAAGPDQEITVVSQTVPTVMDPQNSTSGGMYNATWRLAEGLVTLGHDGELFPQLAAEMPTRVDDTTWEVKLREDIEFSSGNPLNADAVEFSIKRGVDPDFASVVSEFRAFDPDDPIEVIDDYTVHLKTLAPDPTLPNKLGSIKILDPEGEDPVNHPVGTGPYMLESYRTGTQAVLVHNPRYYGEKPQITKVTIDWVADDATRIQSLRAGDADLVTGIGPDQIPNVEYFAASKEPVWSTLLQINTFKIKDLRVRQALNYAIDRESLAKDLFLGYAEPQACQLTGFASDANPELEPYAYDPEKARQLLEQAGATGDKLQIDWPATGYPITRQYGTVVAEQLRAAGLDVEINFRPYEQQLERFAGPGEEYAQVMFSAGTNPTGTVLRILGLFYSSEGGRSAFSDPNVDELVAKASTTFDAEERQGYINEATAAACEQAPFLYTVEYHDLFGLGERLTWEPGESASVGRLWFDEMTVVEPGT